MRKTFLSCQLTDRESSSYIVKYNLHTERVDAQISLSGLSPRKNGYQWCGGYCAVDLAVDEQGLYVGTVGGIRATATDCTHIKLMCLEMQ